MFVTCQAALIALQQRPARYVAQDIIWILVHVKYAPWLGVLTAQAHLLAVNVIKLIVICWFPQLVLNVLQDHSQIFWLQLAILALLPIVCLVQLLALAPPVILPILFPYFPQICVPIVTPLLIISSIQHHWIVKSALLPIALTAYL